VPVFDHPAPGLSRARSLSPFLWCFVALLISGIVLRVEAAIYGRKIISVVSALSTLRVGETSKAETLSRLPMLRTSPTAWSSDSRCGADECALMSDRYVGSRLTTLDPPLVNMGGDTGPATNCDVVTWTVTRIGQ
jgi:hypothetical protein